MQNISINILIVKKTVPEVLDVLNSYNTSHTLKNNKINIVFFSSLTSCIDLSIMGMHTHHM